MVLCWPQPHFNDYQAAFTGCIDHKHRFAPVNIHTDRFALQAVSRKIIEVFIHLNFKYLDVLMKWSGDAGLKH